MKAMERKGVSVRKVWRSEKSLVISLPKEWSKEGIIREGQEFIIQRESDRIVLVPAITVPLEEVQDALSR